VEHAREKGLSERWACRLLRQPRGTQRYQPSQRQDEGQLTQAIIALACQYGRYGYRRITALLQLAGWFVGKDRVQRIWRREGLKVPAKQKPSGSTTDPASGCGPSGGITSGATTSWKPARMTGAACGS
jgi:hypothetical protein